MAEFALGSIVQVARHVRDIEASTAWYRDVLGLKHLYQFGELSFFDCDGVRLYLQQSQALGSDSILYFRVSDIEAAHKALVERGVNRYCLSAIGCRLGCLPIPRQTPIR